MKNLSQLHDESFENEKLLKKVKKCGCFYCNRIFMVSDIKVGLMMKMEIRQFVHIVE